MLQTVQCEGLDVGYHFQKCHKEWITLTTFVHEFEEYATGLFLWNCELLHVDQYWVAFTVARLLTEMHNGTCYKVAAYNLQKSIFRSCVWLTVNLCHQKQTHWLCSLSVLRLSHWCGLHVASERKLNTWLRSQANKVKVVLKQNLKSYWLE